MKRWRTVALLLALAGTLATGLLLLFNAQFQGGELYPEYSSLRADPRGAKLLYAGLSRIAGIRLARNFQPFNALTTGGATLLLLSADPLALGFDVVEKAAGRANRIVISLPDDFSPDAPARFAYRKWHLKFPIRKTDASPMYFQQAGGWTILASDENGPLVIERPFGKGSVVLFARSQEFSNQSVAAAGAMDELSAALGPGRFIVFDESHLGIAETGSVVELARRFRLLGFAGGLALLAALFIWRNAESFPPGALPLAAAPPPPRAPGLQTLLRKHIAPRDLAAACWKEWRLTHAREVSAPRLARAEEILKSQAARPLDAVTQLQILLHSKGEL
jgi:hypothetical protein